MVAIAPLPPDMPIRPLTVGDYQHLIESGCFGPEEHIELLNGQLIQRAAKGTRHTAAVSRIAHLVGRVLGEQVLIRLQDPIQLDDRSQPEPDLAIVRPHPTYYADQHPTPAEIHWLIEIADTTLAYDRHTKAQAYARQAIADYWIVDLKGDRLWVLRQPDASGYGSQSPRDRSETIAPLAFPDRSFSVADLLGPVA